MLSSSLRPPATLNLTLKLSLVSLRFQGGTDQDHRARTSLGRFTTLARLAARTQLNPSLFRCRRRNRDVK
jgi:hypothetical protein